MLSGARYLPGSQGSLFQTAQGIGHEFNSERKSVLLITPLKPHDTGLTLLLLLLLLLSSSRFMHTLM